MHNDTVPDGAHGTNQWVENVNIQNIRNVECYEIVEWGDIWFASRKDCPGPADHAAIQMLLF